MDPEKFAELQKQMRINNHEVENFLTDLESWRKTVDAKDAQLQNKNNQAAELPAIRNSLLRKQRKKMEHESKPVKKPMQRIKSRDYHSWDKFDVDKALAEVDDVPSQVMSNSSETDEEAENSRRISLSKDSRELGNLRFKEGKFDEAVEHYTMSVRLTPEDPIPLINRAFAHLKMERYASAEADCSAALVLDSGCVKALFRRALARKHLGKKSQAIADLEVILQSDRENSIAWKELAALTDQTVEQIKQRYFKPCTAYGDSAQSLKTERVFRRVPIVEVGSAGLELNAPSNRISPLVDRPSSVLSPKIPSVTANDKPVNGTGELTNRHQVVSPMVTLNPDGPSNWFQLQRELRELNRTGSSKTSLTTVAIDYLCNIPPDRYALVIGDNLEPGFITQLFYAFSNTTLLTSTDIMWRLYRLTQLPRFNVSWMMTDECDRDRLRALIRRAEHDPHIPLDVLGRIRSGFGAD